MYFIFQKSTEEALKAQSAGVIRSAAPPKEKRRKVEEVSMITPLNFSTVPWIAVCFPAADPADWGGIIVVHYTRRPPLFPSGLRGIVKPVRLILVRQAFSVSADAYG